jgi:hypothetical protein
MSETTGRLGLPLIAPGQAQKELTHNEALALIDLAIQPVVEAIGVNDPPAAPAIGLCWIVGAAPTGRWAGRATALAGWTAGGWRFQAARSGMTVRRNGDGAILRYDGTTWRVPPVVTAANGGSVIDVEARNVLQSVIDLLRDAGLAKA